MSVAQCTERAYALPYAESPTKLALTLSPLPMSRSVVTQHAAPLLDHLVLGVARFRPVSHLGVSTRVRTTLVPLRLDLTTPAPCPRAAVFNVAAVHA